jgi:hypothetical protein
MGKSSIDLNATSTQISQKMLITTSVDQVSSLALIILNNCSGNVVKSTHDTHYDRKDASGAIATKPIVQQLKHQMKSSHFVLGSEGTKVMSTSALPHHTERPEASRFSIDE